MSGKGTTLLYLPGPSFPSVEQFLSVVTHDDMAAYHSLLVDYIGSGFSDHSQDFDYSIENHARSMAAVLDYEGIKGCVVIGHSMGGTVGTNAILRELNRSAGEPLVRPMDWGSNTHGSNHDSCS